MRTLMLIIFIAMAVSCNKVENNSEYESINIDIGFQILLNNKQGQNLLNPEISGSYKHSEIKLYSDSLLLNSIPDTFLLSSNGVFFLNFDGGGLQELKRGNDRVKYGTLFLQLNSSTIDTIYSESIYKGESLLLNKVVYNSKEVFDIEVNKVDRGITVIKE